MAARSNNRLLLSAEEKERRYDWWGAAADYSKAVKTHLDTGNLQAASRIYGRIGLCFQRAAFQAETHNAFQKRIKSATDAYERAADLFRKLKSPNSAANVTRAVVEIRPRVLYVNYHGDFETHDVESILLRPAITFESKHSHRIFTYLVNAFRNDHLRERMPVERSGWRTRTQILAGAKGIHKRHVYGVRGQLGSSLLRLHNSGLIETDVITGGRGRSGRTTRIRIAHTKEVIRKLVFNKETTPMP